jgi:ketosteroid isomerase-like protein
VSAENSKKLIREWFDVIASGAFDAWPTFAHKDIVMRIPFAPGGMPTEMFGYDAAISGVQAFWQTMKSFKWMYFNILATEDPDFFAAMARSEADTIFGPYANSYVLFIRLRDGKVIEHIEYFNPLPVTEVFKPMLSGVEDGAA